MPFFQQLRAAIRLQIEDFFRVRASNVMVMLGVIAALIAYTWLRTTHPWPQLFGWQSALLLVVLILLRFMRR